MDKFIAGVAVAAVGLAMAIAFGALLAFPVMWCWNDTVSTLFGLRQITFTQAWSLLILCSILFKSTSTGSNN